MNKVGVSQNKEGWGGGGGGILLNYQWNLDAIRLACVQSRNTCCDTHLSTGDVW